MTTARAVITGALRRLGVVGGTGRRTPSLTEFEDALRILLSLYRTLITGGAFGRMRDVVPRGDYVGGENQRIFRRYNEQQTILLPDLVSRCGTIGYCTGSTPAPIPGPIVASTDYGVRPYGCHLTDDRRTIRDGSVVTLVDEFTGDLLEAIYDGQRKLWFTISDLDTGELLDEANEWSIKRLNDALDLDVPLAHRDQNGLIALLATLLADDFAADVPPMTIQQAQQFKKSLTANYSFDPGDQCLT